MDLGLREQAIEHQNFGYTFSLITTNGYEISIETDFTLNTAGQTLSYSPGPSNAEAKPLVNLKGQSITTATAENNGTLTIQFTNGDILQVNPNQTYEAWTIAGPDGIEAVCMPGGTLTTWNTGTT